MTKRAFLLVLSIVCCTYWCSAQKAPSNGAPTHSSRFPKLDIEIKLANKAIRYVEDLEIYVIITNNQNYDQTFLFDRPRKPGFGLWEASCTIYGTAATSKVQKYAGRAEYHLTPQEATALKQHAYTIKAHEWFIRKFSVSDICVFNEKVCLNNVLPPDNYSMQLMFQANQSNIVHFTVR